MSDYGKCPSCSKWVPKGDTECPHCGSELGAVAHLNALFKHLIPKKSARGSRLCVACNKLLGVDDTECPYCGVLQTSARKAARVMGDALPSGMGATHALLGVMVALFLIPVVAMGDVRDFNVMGYLMSGDHRALMLMGANHGILLEAGQTWRLVTATFLHIGLMHIVFNGYALHILGNPLEELYGRGWYVTLYVVTGVVGNVVSWSGHGIQFANAGASGSIFGLIGIGIVHCWRHRWANRQLLRLLVTWAIFGLVFGVIIGADNHAHVGGLVSGGALAWLLPSEKVTQKNARMLGNALGVATAIGVAVCFILAVMAAPELKPLL
jgi:rhomboid protease GluP